MRTKTNAKFRKLPSLPVSSPFTGSSSYEGLRKTPTPNLSASKSACSLDDSVNKWTQICSATGPVTYNEFRHLSSTVRPLSHAEYRTITVLHFRQKRLKRKALLLDSYPGRNVRPFKCPAQQTKLPVLKECCSTSHPSALLLRKGRGRPRNPSGRECLEVIPTEPMILKITPDCRHCGAMKFPYETSNFCCSDGDVTLPLVEIPDELKEMLLNPTTSNPRNFRVMISAYNNHLAFTSLGVKYDHKLAQRNKGIYTFRVQGQVYHWITSLAPDDDPPKNLMFYYHDIDFELANRIANCPELDEQTLASLIKILEVNTYARFFRALSATDNVEECKIILKHNPETNSKTYAKPTVSQVAILLDANESTGEISHRDIRVYKHSGEAKTIQYFYGCYDGLQYPLLFAYGNSGWYQGIPRNGVKKYKKRPSNLLTQSGKAIMHFATAEDLLRSEEKAAGTCEDTSAFVSLREYYAYKFQVRPNDNSHILRFGRLFQQYCVDMYVKIETQRLDFFRAKARQDHLRQECYQGLVDALNSGETEPSKIGQRIVLPSSFIGGPRYMRKRYLDAMTLVQKFGKPDIFLTITCNSSWPEIKDQLLPCELAQDRPDLTTRVFHSKLEELKVELLKKHVFGEVRAYSYVIEYQKRGLPHAHFLLILKNSHKLHDPTEYDKLVSAEIPDKDLHPALHAAVVKHMLHGPCGVLNPSNVCMRKNSRCKDNYPKEFCSDTRSSTNSYPIYRRRDDGNKVKIRGAWLDNRWIVPHPPYLVAMFDCHINIEICSSIKAVKYIYKYICKRSDRILFQLTDSIADGNPIDEIDKFVSARWISPPEAMWRIFRFPMNEMKPPVMSLPLHLENYQPVTFPTNGNLSNICQNPDTTKTMLTEFFLMNRTNQNAISLKCKYHDFPSHFVWLSTQKKWSYRNKGESIGRIVIAHPGEGERYYLRMLLSTTEGPTSFVDLKTVDGCIAATFREAANLKGLLQQDDSQEQCMEEAATFQMPYALRRLFASILAYSTPNNPEMLFLRFEDSLSQDFVSTNTCSSTVRQKVLHQIGMFLRSMGKKIEDYITCIPHQLGPIVEDLTKELMAETSIVVSDEDLRLQYLLNHKQKEAFTIITSAIHSGKGGSFFVDGPGGTGKTFLYKALLAEVRAKGFFALATATSGIAASILPGGRTAHSRFKIPLDTNDFTTCRVSKQSTFGQLIRECKLIIWDEAPMAKRVAMESLDDLLRDLMSCDDIFGGKVVVLGGDFRQILPVVQHGSKTQTLASCLINSPLWHNIQKLHLEENMRARTDPDFTSYLMVVGEGKGNEDDAGQVILPTECVVKSTDDENADILSLIDSIYPNIGAYTPTIHKQNKAILSTKNQFVEEINELLISKFPGLPVTYTSYDETINPHLQGHYQDIINNLSPNGLPPHKLVLKVHCPIILLRNLDPTEGLCNGTRLECKVLKKNVIQAEICFGNYAGKTVFLHRIPLQPTDNEAYPVQYKRVQFPIRLCFAMTINKSQGQTLDSVGIYLKEPVFSHGQLYVALSHVKSLSAVKVLVPKKPDADERETLLKTLFSKRSFNFK